MQKIKQMFRSSSLSISDMDLKEITDDMVIPVEDPEHNAYNDVTEIVKRQRFDTPLRQPFGRMDR